MIGIDELPVGSMMRRLAKDRSMLVEEADRTPEGVNGAVTPAISGLLEQLRSFEDQPGEVGIKCGKHLSAQTRAFIASIALESNFTMSMTRRSRAAET